MINLFLAVSFKNTYGARSEVPPLEYCVLLYFKPAYCVSIPIKTLIKQQLVARTCTIIHNTWVRFLQVRQQPLGKSLGQALGCLELCL